MAKSSAPAIPATAIASQNQSVRFIARNDHRRAAPPCKDGTRGLRPYRR
jgi:hypothetical protein